MSRQTGKQAPSSLLRREPDLRAAIRFARVAVNEDHVNDDGEAFGGPANVAGATGRAVCVRIRLTLDVPGLEVPGRDHPVMAVRGLAADVAGDGNAAVLVGLGIADGCRNFPGHN